MTKFEQKVQKYGPRFKKDLLLTDEQVAGIFGNFGTETGGFAHMQELKPVSGRGGYGWAQWTGPRRVAFEEWCKDNNLDIKTDDANYLYTVYELRNSESKALTQLKKTKTVDAAAETFMAFYERPGVKNLADRKSWATKAYNVLVKTPSEEPVILPADKPKDTTSGSITALILATLGSIGTALTSKPAHAVYIIAGVIIVAGIAGYIVHKIKNKEAA